jgi:hypothetical protein
MKGEEGYVSHFLDTEICLESYAMLKDTVKFIGVTKGFKEAVSTFSTELGTPAGFQRNIALSADGVLRVDLVKDISNDKIGAPHLTKALYSADTADPYEVVAISPFLANLACNMVFINKLLCEPEFIDMQSKVVITPPPNYLSRFTLTNHVISYQLRFRNATKGQK